MVRQIGHSPDAGVPALGRGWLDRVGWPGQLDHGEHAMSFSHFLRALRAVAQAPRTQCGPLPGEPEAVENDYFRFAHQPRD